MSALFSRKNTLGGVPRFCQIVLQDIAFTLWALRISIADRLRTLHNIGFQGAFVYTPKTKNATIGLSLKEKSRNLNQRLSVTFKLRCGASTLLFLRNQRAKTFIVALLACAADSNYHGNRNILHVLDTPVAILDSSIHLVPSIHNCRDSSCTLF